MGPGAVAWFLLLACWAAPVAAQERAVRPAEAIQENSFLLEEAYNQEAGVVQHISNLAWFANERGDADDRELTFTFTQEWPVFSQAHQFSYTVPYSYLESNGDHTDGFGDILLNYRLQLLTETDHRPAMAPRFSLILPTGDEDRGLGSGEVGYQFNLPVSKVIADRWTVHANAGLTLWPDVEGHDLFGYNLGASVIYAASPNLNFLLECVALWNEELLDIGGIDRSAQVILSPGVRWAINLHGDLQIVPGLAVPVGLTDDAPEYGVFVYLSVEHPIAR